MDIKDAYVILDEIMDTGEMTDKMKEAVKQLKDSLDERWGELDRYKEQYDGERAAWDKERSEWEERYNNLEKNFRDVKDRYLDRLLTPSEALKEHRVDAESGDLENMETQKEKEIKFFETEEILK